MSFRLLCLTLLFTATTLAGCAVPRQAPNSSRAMDEITRLNNGQQQLTQRLDQLQQQVQQLEARLQEQQATARLQPMAAQKGTTGRQKTEPAAAIPAPGTRRVLRPSSISRPSPIMPQAATSQPLKALAPLSTATPATTMRVTPNIGSENAITLWGLSASGERV
ncbi:MAG: hypothetical protein R2864_08690 [Syntrophotaleaceae bacterium]